MEEKPFSGPLDWESPSNEARFLLGDTVAIYSLDRECGAVELALCPRSLMDRRVVKRKYHTGPEIEHLPARWLPIAAQQRDSLVQVKLRGFPEAGGLSQGQTMRNSPATRALRFVGQCVAANEESVTITTTLRTEGSHAVEHRLSWCKGQKALLTSSTLRNESEEPLTVEMFASFSLSGITPFADDLAADRLKVHRYRSSWAAEGRHVVDTIEQLQLEPSWSGHAVSSERFGQIGSHPVRRWFPFVAVEDGGVFWGARLAAPGSWQMEIYRRSDEVCLSGGLADREFGHWWKTLSPGAEFQSSEAWLACAQGELAYLTDRLLAPIEAPLANGPEIERDLPILFNEWCSSWGSPSLEALEKTLQRLRGSEVKIFVIDDGWAKRSGNNCQQNGDWIPDRKKFPGGLGAATSMIREAGLIPGLWFEPEVCNAGSKAWDETQHLLHRDGGVLTIGDRRFWDFRQKWVHDYLRKKVINRLKQDGFGYLKIDYNESLGIGCDGAESPGEGLRQHLEGVLRFQQSILDDVPGLILECCASGGHRLEPSMLQTASMASFSDAHESVEIPIIAAQLHALLPARMSQIWAVLHPEDTDRRLIYSLAATFLGRMCLSGNLPGLSDSQWEIALKAQRFYRAAAPVIRDGTTRVHGERGGSQRRPVGWQAVLRQHRDRLLVVVHSFANQPSPKRFAIPLPLGPWTTSAAFGECAYHVENGELIGRFDNDYEGSAVLLVRGT